MTAKLWLAMISDLRERHAIAAPSFSLMQTLSRTRRASVQRYMESR